MPFIRGRYHINPTMGEALEAAREAEAALLALEQQAQRNRANADVDSADNSNAADDDNAAPNATSGTGPIHRVEIDATEVTPGSSNRAARGFVARIHRTPATASPPETHVFSDHRDLVDFLRGELARDAENSP
ncbi:MAG: hypothetical protein ABSE45_10295 [Candidatus Acidiferrales bacterium]|jgi:hypothetical protein